PRVRRTHATAAIIVFFKSVTLAEKLDRNVKIETENAARKEKTEKHLLDPNAHPTPGSAAASMISYTDEDITTLQMPDFLSHRPARPDSFGFFPCKVTTSHLLHSSTLDTVKTNNLDGTTKKVILDVHKLGDTLGPDILPTLGEHEEAAEHHLRFQSSKDAAGDDGPYTTFWHDHHAFFFRQMDKVEYYEAWAPVEAKRRHDFRAEGKTLFDPAAYQFDYQQAKSTFDLRKEF
ncbi:hypothetical protein CPB85DRAFT_1162213, partial [Mucidula mucida]